MTSQIVKLVFEEAKKHEAKKVLEVRVIIGNLTFLAIEQIRFSYSLLVKGTILEKSKLKIEKRKGIGECDNCGYKGSIISKGDSFHNLSIPSLICPRCGFTLKIIDGKECTLKSVRMVV